MTTGKGNVTVKDLAELTRKFFPPPTKDDPITLSLFPDEPCDPFPGVYYIVGHRDARGQVPLFKVSIVVVSTHDDTGLATKAKNRLQVLAKKRIQQRANNQQRRNQ